MLEKPASVAADAFKSAKWDEICKGRGFRDSDAPTIALLCSWHAVVERCMDDITGPGGVQVAYQTEGGDIKALPQLSTMKQASAEIRALNKQLGIDDEAHGEDEGEKREPKLYVIQKNRKSRADKEKGACAV